MIKRIKELRKVLGMNQGEFAQAIGISRSYLSQAEISANGAHFSDKTIKLICDKFNVSEEWLRCGSGDMFVKRTREEIITDFLTDIITEPDESYKKRLIQALAKMTPDQWEELERFQSMLIAAHSDDTKKDA